MREDLIELAKQQADEIARSGHNGWGNTMLALAAALEAAREDALRYRWIRGQDNEDFRFSVVKNPHFDVYASAEELDTAIDQARAADGGA